MGCSEPWAVSGPYTVGSIQTGARCRRTTPWLWSPQDSSDPGGLHTEKSRVGVLFGYFLWFFFGYFFMVFRSADARVSQSVKQLVSQLVDSRPSGQSVGEPTERSVSQSVGQPTERPVSQSVSQSVSGQR